MAKKTVAGSTKRFGVRYGARNKDKLGLIEKEQRAAHKCPFCSYKEVKRISAGIWQCKKCNTKIAGKAYAFGLQRKGKYIEATEEVTEEIEVDEPVEGAEDGRV
jgi:large subunit ribosomal protein L37Ae